MSSQRIKNTELIKPHYDCTLEVIAYNSRPNCDKLDKLKCCLNIIKHENSVFAANFVWLIKNILLLSLMFLLSFAILAVRTNTVSGTYTSQILMLIKPGLSLNGLFFFLLVAGCESCSVAKCLPNAIGILNAQSPYDLFTMSFIKPLCMFSAVSLTIFTCYNHKFAVVIDMNVMLTPGIQ